MHHLGPPAPAATDAPGREAGVGHQPIHPLGAEGIPLPQLVELEPHQRSEGAARQGGTLEIGVHLIPGVTHRGVYIAHMQLVRADEHPLSHQVAAAHH